MKWRIGLRWEHERGIVWYRYTKNYAVERNVTAEVVMVLFVAALAIVLKTSYLIVTDFTGGRYLNTAIDIALTAFMSWQMRRVWQIVRRRQLP